MNATDTPINLVWLGAVAALIGGIVAFIGAMIHNAQQLTAKVDENLRDTRIKLYKPLWTQTQLVPRWSKPNNVTGAQLAHFGQTLNTWYFSDGGIYMSVQARRAYIDLQKALKPYAEGKGDVLTALDDKKLNAVAKRFGRLRKELSRDIVSRSRILWSP